LRFLVGSLSFYVFSYLLSVSCGVFELHIQNKPMSQFYGTS